MLGMDFKAILQNFLVLKYTVKNITCFHVPNYIVKNPGLLLVLEFKVNELKVSRWKLLISQVDILIL